MMELRDSITISVKENGQLVAGSPRFLLRKTLFSEKSDRANDWKGMGLMSQKLQDLHLLTECTDTCVIVEGSSGCGKTALLQKYTSELKGCTRHELVVIHLGEQIDSKMLLGTYTSTSMPGEFVWLPGVLTKAVVAGKWVIMEDIDCAPPDVVSLLLPLVKHRQIMVPGYGEPIHAAAGFKMFLTQRLSETYTKVHSFQGGLLGILKHHSVLLHLPPFSTEEVKEIITTHYPNLQPLAEKLTCTSMSLGMHLRHILKLCERISPQVQDGCVSSMEDLMLELIDCLCGHLVAEKRLAMAVELSSLCGGMAREKVEHLCLAHKPSLQLSPTAVSVGRAYIPRHTIQQPRVCYAHTQNSLRLLECVCRCVQMSEPVLLVGETGVGKTATINYLATISGNKLVVVNMSQQTDSSDLLGGFKPVQVAQLVSPVREEFEKLFHNTFSVKQNAKYLASIQASFAKQHWKRLFRLMLHSLESALKRVKDGKGSNPLLYSRWKSLGGRLKKLQKQMNKPQAAFAFSFVEGALVEAVEKGWWILLDEINLASPETLQCLSSLLEGPEGSFLLAERVDSKPVERHVNFRLFCCMNPATDVGKKSLPQSIRNRFTEFFVDELQSTSDLTLLVTNYLKDIFPSPSIIGGIISIYRSMRDLAESRLQDGTGRKPHYSLRSLCRALQYAANNPCGMFKRSLYEGFCMSFLSELHQDYHGLVMAQIKQCLALPESSLSTLLPRPVEGNSVMVAGFWLKVGSESSPHTPEDYVLTESVGRNLKNLARVVSARHHPVLLQGPTSAGKTSLVQYLAKATGHRCLRINNHEHTDLQEYVGMYTANRQGQLVFQEGVLVTAMRKGYWVILDELNLAPTDVLEALNRVLDDNRELFIPETQEMVKAHPDFLLFGTQNPPGIYGGRKMLSRAFRNRFIELHYDDIPSVELVCILQQRCKLPPSYATKMVAVMKELQQRRSVSGIFAGKYGLITLRDLFRWAERYRRSPDQKKFHDWEQQLAEDGFMLLGGRLRNPTEEEVIREVVQKHFKRTVTPSLLFGHDGGFGCPASKATLELIQGALPEGFSHLVWTPQLLKMAVLVHRAMQFDEPVLLVGNTGCGKTTLCQLIASLLHRKLYSINCHMHTESADFLGGLRPIRDRASWEGSGNTALFEWTDGIVVQAMKEGGCLLIDEISLAEDAVLERLNSVLEPERKLLISERSQQGEEVYEVTAKEGFVFMATMNPGGDYGKKELSPSLRNRFVEIWCPCASERESLKKIIDHNLKPELHESGNWSNLMLNIVEWLQSSTLLGSSMFSIRDLLTWVGFMNTTTPQLSPGRAFYHGAHLVFLDALGCSGSGALGLREGVRKKAMAYLHDLLVTEGVDSLSSPAMDAAGDGFYGIAPFFIEKGPYDCPPLCAYSLEAHGPHLNAFRLLRALQMGKPLLLEGAPGVGKTSLVTALAQASGHHVTRINLSEHTDISDLFGSDLPVEGGKGVKFEWRDGPFLKALKCGEWILLDEMNLASQSVLEGLNACLDHRGEIYIPELGMTFSVQVGTRLFACQNPLQQGGGRKGLPKSYVNRFTQVYVDPLTAGDLLFITSTLYPECDKDMLRKMIAFNSKVSSMVLKYCGGITWEFNLRDVLRWCELMLKHQTSRPCNPGTFVNLIYGCRLRDGNIRTLMESLFMEVFACEGSHPLPVPLGSYFHVSMDAVQIGHCVLKKRDHHILSEVSIPPLLILHCQIPVLEALMHCVDMGWMAILVGGSCSGKYSVLRTLAQLTGHKLLEFPMNSDTDTTELLGGFEQVACSPLCDTTCSQCSRYCIAYECTRCTGKLNFGRHCSNLASIALDVAHSLQASAMKQLQAGSNPSLQECAETLTALTVQLVEKYSPSVCIGDDVGKDELINQCLELKDTLNQLQQISDNLHVPLHCDMEEVLKELCLLNSKLQESDAAGQFEWVDSVLVRALKYGYWLLISNANFCNPSVLDRLNPVLEPNGVLSVDERGVVGGTIPTIVPHPNFRLFLSMDPSHGEISRAMRNRGIEICILPEETLCAMERHKGDWCSLIEACGISDASFCSQLMDTCVDRTPNPKQVIHAARCYLNYHDDAVLSSEVLLAKVAMAIGISPSQKPSQVVPEASPVVQGESPLKERLNGTNYTVTVLDYVLHPNGTSVQRDLSPILFSLNTVICDKRLQRFNSELSHALQMFSFAATRDDYPIRLSSLQQLVTQLHARPQTVVELKACISGLTALIDHPDTCNTLEELEKSDDSCRHMIMSINPHISCLLPDDASTLMLRLDRLCLMYRIVSQVSLLEEHSRLYPKPGETSTMQLSYQAHSGILPLERLPHQSLMHMQPFFMMLLNVMKACIATSTATSSIVTLSVLDKKMDWLSTSIRAFMEPQLSLSFVAVKWSLLYKECLKPLLATVSQHSDVTLLHIMLKNLEALNYITTHGKMLSSIRDVIGHPIPPVSHHTLDCKNEAVREDRLLKGRSQLKAPYLMFSNETVGDRRALCKSLCQAYHPELCDNTEKGTYRSREEHMQISSPENSSAPLFTTHPAVIGTFILPAVYCLKQLVLEFLSPSLEIHYYSTKVSELTALIDYCLRLCYVSISDLEPVVVWEFMCNVQENLEKVHVQRVLRSVLPKAVECCCTGLNAWSDVLPADITSMLMPVNGACSKMCFLLLSPNNESKKLGLMQVSTVTIGNHLDKLEELRVLLQHLWLHGCCQVYCPLSNISLEWKLTNEMLRVFLIAVHRAVIGELNSQDDGKMRDSFHAMMNASFNTPSTEAISSVCTAAAAMLHHGLKEGVWNETEYHLLSAYKDLSTVESMINPELVETYTEVAVLGLLSTAKVHLGIAQTLVLHPAQVDPLAIATAEYQFYSELSFQAEELVKACDRYYQTVVGISILPDNGSATEENLAPTTLAHTGISPYMVSALEKKRFWCDKLQRLPVTSANRTEDTKYTSLVNMSTDIMNTLCSPRRIEAVLSAAKSVARGSNDIQKVTSWVKATSAAMQRLKEDFVTFPDVVQPFTTAIQLVLNGVNSMAWLTAREGECESVLAESIRHLVQFPFFTSNGQGTLFLVKKLTNMSAGGIKGVSMKQWTDIQRGIIQVAVETSLNYVKTTAAMSVAWKETISNLLEHCWSLWLQADNEARIKAREEENLYRYKVTSHQITESEEEEELANLFPSYEDEFPSEEEQAGNDVCMDLGRETQETTLSEKPSCQFSSEDMHKICCLHLLSCSRSYKSGTISMLDVKGPIHQAYQIAGRLSSISDNIQGDHHVIGGHARMCHSLLTSMKAESSAKKNAFNIYKDSDESEAQKVLPVLNDIITRVQGLLFEWPDHPGLKQIVIACEKVLSLSVQEPLMKILSGLEYVLRRAQDWEAYAASHVSLFKQLEALTQLILDWRKMELNSSKNLLPACTREVETSAAKWWFHLYSLCKAQVDSKDDQSAIDEFTVAVQRFMETSTLGEFQCRLYFLDGFSVYMFQQGSDKAAHILRNTFHFYSQFLSAVESSIQEMAIPVEKEFKEYLTILRWNDGNYWALKATTEKSHRALLKFMTKYKAILTQPVQPILSDTSLERLTLDKSDREQTDTEVKILKAVDEQSHMYLTDLDIQATLPPGSKMTVIGDLVEISASDAFIRMRLLVSRLISTDLCSKWSYQVDMFTDEAISTMQYLQSSEFLNGLEGDKRKAAVKLGNAQKRKALGDLFKALKQQGLSYRKGVEWSEDFRVYSFKLQSTEPTTDTGGYLSTLWEDLNKKFYCCVARMAGLQTACIKPSKELTVGQISRCKGYASHLMMLVCEKRRVLAEALQSGASLHYIVQQLKLLAEEQPNCCFVSPEKYGKQLSSLRTTLEQCLEAISNFSNLISTMPEGLDFTLTPLHRDILPPIIRDKDTKHSAVLLLKEHLYDLRDHYAAAVKEELEWTRFSPHFVTVTQVFKLKEIHAAVEHFNHCIAEVLHLTMGKEKYLGMLDFLRALQKHIATTSQDFSQWIQWVMQPPPTSEIILGNGFHDQGAKVMRMVLLCVQQVMKRHYSDRDVSSDVEDFAYCKSLHSSATENLNLLSSSEVLKELNILLMTTIKQDPQSAVRTLLALYPLLHQYTCLHDRLQVELMVSHYTLCNLLSVLLQTFTTLLSKGFCIPPEAVDSPEDQSGATEFVDLEAGGFDEGEGAKNVSSEVDPGSVDTGQSKPTEEQDQDQPKQHQEEEKEEDALEMAGDFQGSLEDFEPEDESSGSDGETEQKQMGELGQGEEDQLDRKMWAPEDEEDKHEHSEKQEQGGGTSLEEDKIVAKEEESEGCQHEGEPQKEMQDPFESGLDQLEDADNQINNDSSKDYTEPPESLEEEDDQSTDFGELDMDAGEGDSEESSTEEPSELQHNPTEGDSEEESDEMKREEDNLQTSEGNQPVHLEDQVYANATQSMDMSSYAGIVANTVESSVESSMEPNASSSKSKDEVQDIAEGPSFSMPNITYDKSGDSTSATVPQISQKESELPEKGSHRKPPTRSKNERCLADDEERAVKRQRLMEYQQTEDDTTKQSNESSLYQHMRTETSKHDAVAWDATYTEPPGLPQELPESGVLDTEGEEMMDTTPGELPSSSQVNLPLMETEAVLGTDLSDKIGEEDKDSRNADQDHKTKQRRILSIDSFYAHGDIQLLEHKQALDEDSIRENLKLEVTVLHSEQQQKTNLQALGATELWVKYEQLTSPLSHILCEELRLILQPTQAAQLKGDFHTGKRLNMRRIIPYIASNFQNDRIWLRRVKPSKREYQIIIAVDDSSSMNENDCNQMAYESLALISNALSRLDCGQLGICRFGESAEVLHPLDQPFSSNSGGFILQHLTFTQTKTNFVQLLRAVQCLFSQSLIHQSRNRTSPVISQLLVILSDGRGVFADGTLPVEVAIRKLNELGVFTIFVILDSLSKDSIVEIKVPTFIHGKPPVIKTYLETFPFPFYIVLRDITSLPAVLGQALRQWFELVCNRVID